MHPRTDRRRNSGQRKLADRTTENILLTALLRQERWCNGELRASPAVSKDTDQATPGRMQDERDVIKVSALSQKIARALEQSKDQTDDYQGIFPEQNTAYELLYSFLSIYRLKM